MSIETLKFIKEQLEKIITYSFVTAPSDSTDPYWVGEYMEGEELNEDGMRETQFILTGTTRTMWTDLETDKSKIKELFKELRVILPNGNGLLVYYLNSLIIPVEDAQLKRIQINLQIKEWEV